MNKYSSKISHFCNFYLISRYTIDFLGLFALQCPNMLLFAPTRSIL